MNNNPAIEAKGVNHFYAKVYGIFALGLGISAISAYLAMTMFFEQTISFIDSFPLGLTGIWLAEIILVVLLSAKAQKKSFVNHRRFCCLFAVKRACFIGYFIDVYASLGRKSFCYSDSYLFSYGFIWGDDKT